jgi:transposase
MGRTLQINWQEEANKFKQLYRQETHIQRRDRLFVLWHLRSGNQIKDVSQLTGISYRVIQRWIDWYRFGGLSEVLQRVTGHMSQGKQPYLTSIQQKALVARVALGDFRTVWDVMEWVKGRWGVVYSYEGLRSMLKRHKLGLKVPRPHSVKADLQVQEQWQKNALRDSTIIKHPNRVLKRVKYQRTIFRVVEVV